MTENCENPDGDVTVIPILTLTDDGFCQIYRRSIFERMFSFRLEGRFIFIFELRFFFVAFLYTGRKNYPSDYEVPVVSVALPSVI